MPTETATEVLDELNLGILRELTADARLRTTELARRLGVSTPTIRDRMSRLEETGVIRGYRVDIDPGALGRPVAAWIRLRPGPGQVHRASEYAGRVPAVAECHRITGEDCLPIRVQVASLPALEEVIDGFGPYGQTTSSLVVATPVEARPVPLG